MTSDWSTKPDCRLFNGFSPCRYRRSCEGCTHYDPVPERILLIQLDALGDVLRTTALAPALRRAHPRAHLTWLTRAGGAALLAGNPLVDRVIVLSESTPVVLASLRFDLALCPDKSIPAGALMNYVHAEEKRGFTIDETGAIVPLGESAAELYRMGLDNEMKFFGNTKSAQQLMTEAVALDYRRDRYVVVLDDQERRWARDDRHVAGVEDDEILIGWNTGCGPRYPYKKHTVQDQVRLMVSAWGRIPRKDRTRFSLLGGGPEDERRNGEIATALEDSRIPVVRTPCTQGIRRGIAAVAACDMVVSGDSLGLHLAIGLKKPVVAWFGLTCHQEIDVYGRGIKVLSNVGCRPCWLGGCPLTPKCFADMPWDAYADSIAEMASVLLRDGSWVGERLVGVFPPAVRIPQPLGGSPGPVY